MSFNASAKASACWGEKTATLLQLRDELVGIPHRKRLHIGKYTPMCEYRQRAVSHNTGLSETT